MENKNKEKAHKIPLRNQRIKTYALTPFWLVAKSIWVLALVFFFLGLAVKWMFYKPIDTAFKSSKDKLALQKGLYKPIKKERKLNSKDYKKEVKENNKEDIKTLQEGINNG